MLWAGLVCELEITRLVLDGLRFELGEEVFVEPRTFAPTKMPTPINVSQTSQSVSGFLPPGRTEAALSPQRDPSRALSSG